MPEPVPYALAGWAAYAAVALAAMLVLTRRWRGAENGLDPVYVALAWPLVLPLLAAYYVGAIGYTGGLVLRGRRAAGTRAPTSRLRTPQIRSARPPGRRST